MPENMAGPADFGPRTIAGGSRPLIATVTLNPAVDLAFEVERILPGESTRVLAVRRDPGGKGINVSRAVQEFGGRTVACGLVGGYTGDLLERYLEDEGTPAAFSSIGAETRQNVVIRDRSGGPEIRLSAPGPGVLPEELDRLRKRVCCLPEPPDAVVLSGSLPPRVLPEAYVDIMHEAHRAGLPTVLDADGEALRTALAAGPFLVKPNRHEAAAALGRDLPGLDDLAAAGAELRTLGAAHVAVTSGGGEAMFAGPKGTLVAVPPQVEAVSAVGCGDVFVGVLTLRLLQGSSEEEALRWAVAAGSATAATAGTSPGHRDHADRLLDQVVVKRWG